jgi:lipopolysaccharide/colanic/teichoic acid biosynthesis glycosyltransferase
VKRILDLLLAAACLPMLVCSAVPLVIAAIAARLPSVVFVQSRVGRNGRRLSVVKFRSMDEEGRTTRFHRVVRTLGVDELPQVLSVLQGRMSFVGPRPLLVEDLFPPGVSVDRRLWEAAALRQSVLPGITGVSQILGRSRSRRGSSYWSMLEADLWYVRHRSLSLDLALIGRTVLYCASGGRWRYRLRKCPESPAGSSAPQRPSGWKPSYVLTRPSPGYRWERERVPRHRNRTTRPALTSPPGPSNRRK